MRGDEVGAVSVRAHLACRGMEAALFYGRTEVVGRTKGGYALAVSNPADLRRRGHTFTGGIESCFHGNHPEYIETTEKMM